MNQMRTLPILILLMSLISCSVNEERSHSANLGVEQEREILFSVIRYLNGPVRGSTYETMFDELFNASYEEVLETYRIESLLEDDVKDSVWMLVSRPAPSLYERRVAIGLRTAWDETGSVTHYEEMFRTWRMAPEELEVKAQMLFTRMVKGQDLSRYLTVNSNGEEYIEFPNEAVWFDPELRRWVQDPEDPLSTLLRENRSATAQ